MKITVEHGCASAPTLRVDGDPIAIQALQPADHGALLAPASRSPRVRGRPSPGRIGRWPAGRRDLRAGATGATGWPAGRRAGATVRGGAPARQGGTFDLRRRG